MMLQLKLWLLLETAVAFPSYRSRFPMGYKMPCYPGAQGCSRGVELMGEPASVCRGVGHATCAGGTWPLNPFGAALSSAGFEWTTALCNADSDGDGQTNGQELGDPCCQWREGAAESPYMAKFTASHPGVASSRQEGYSAPSCNTTEVAPAFVPAKMGVFNEGEEQRTLDFRVKNYTIPAQRTVYVDFVFNFHETDHPVYHIVFGTALVHQPRHLHHYVVSGCSRQVSEEQVGMPRSSPPSFCNIPVGGFAAWAPGSVLWDMPTYAGVPIGTGVGIVAFSVQVHFTDGDKAPGTVSQDGLRLHYTPTLRKQTVDVSTPINIGSNRHMRLPPKENRIFVTRTCAVADPCKDTADDVLMSLPGAETTCRKVANEGLCRRADAKWACPVSCGVECPVKEKGAPLVSVQHHAHLLGHEMYLTLTKAHDGSVHDLGSQAPYYYDDQPVFSLLSKQLTVEAGDIIQSTCVYNTQARDEETPMGIETVNEMCIISMGTSRDVSTANSPFAIRCEGDIWAGLLGQDDNVSSIKEDHPLSDAKYVWRPSLEGEAIGRPTVNGAVNGAGPSYCRAGVLLFFHLVSLVS